MTKIAAIFDFFIILAQLSKKWSIVVSAEGTFSHLQEQNL
jgi:hypothetical protein